MPNADLTPQVPNRPRKSQLRLIPILGIVAIIAVIIIFQRQRFKTWWIARQPYASLAQRIENGENDPEMLLHFAHKALDANLPQPALKAALAASKSVSLAADNQQAVQMTAEVGYIIARTGDETTASEYLQRAIQASPSNKQAQLGMAILSARRQDYRAAHARLDELLRIDPNNAEAWMRLGTVSLDEGDNPSAVRALEHAIELKPNDAAIHADLGEAYGRLTRFQDAAREQATAIRLDPKETGYRAMHARSLAYAARTENEYAHANDALTQWLQDNQDDDGMRLIRAGLHLRFARFNEAKADLEASISRDPSNVDAIFNLSTVLYRLNDPRAARVEQEFQRLIDKDVAIVELLRAVERKPLDFRLRVQLSSAYRARGRFQEAFQQVSTAAQIAPANQQVQAMYRAAKEYIERAKYSNAKPSGMQGIVAP